MKKVAKKAEIPPVYYSVTHLSRILDRSKGLVSKAINDLNIEWVLSPTKSSKWVTADGLARLESHFASVKRIKSVKQQWEEKQSKGGV